MKGLRLLTVSFLSLFCYLLAAPAGAITITYNVDNDPGKLQTLPAYMAHLPNYDQPAHLYPSDPSGPLASDNTLNISADVPSFAFGGLIENGNSADNTVNISGSANMLGAYGGYVNNTGNATGNTVSLSGSAHATAAFGGYVDNTGNATGNTVNLSDDAIANSVLGGYVDNIGDATGNSVSLSDGARARSVTGGSASNGNATGNSVSLSDSAEVTDDVYGGYVYNTGNATGNTVSMNGGRAGDLYGGNVAGTGNATGNTVSMNGGEADNLFGGHVKSGNAENNKISLDGMADVAGGIYGGYVNTGNATGNSVSLGGMAEVAFVFGGNVRNDGNATGNSVSIGGSAWASSAVTGGQVFGKGNATGNSVSIGDSAWAGTNVIGGSANNGNATGNIVSLGGNAKVGGNVYGGQSGNGNATGNIVSLGGSVKVIMEVYGGYAANGSATGNIVSLGDNAKVDMGVYGGHSGNGSDATSGNILRVSGNGIVVNNIANFEKYEFTLPVGIANGDTMLTSTIGNVNFNNVTTTLALAPGASLNKGDSVTLVDKATNATSFTTSFTGTIANLSTIYAAELNHTNPGDPLTLIIKDSGSTNPRTKALAEGRAASMAFVNQGADMAAGPGLMAAYSSAPGLSAFAAIDGGKSRYKTGSHVDVKGFSMLTGLAWKRPHEANSLMLGGFLEAGWGNYDSHNSFSGFASVEGEGDMSYLGGGLMGRYGLASGLYFDGSMRVGRAKSDFDSDDLNYGGVKADYDSSTTYYGLHLGAGYELGLSAASTLDIYSKYLWTHQGSDSMTVAGDKLKLDSSNSHRLRAGLRYSYTTGKAWAVTPYAGAAYEHEFDGEAGGSIAGRTLDAPELKGGTGIGEAGINISPAKLDNLSLGLGVRGYIGQREGVTGNLEFRWTF